MCIYVYTGKSSLHGIYPYVYVYIWYISIYIHTHTHTHTNAGKSSLLNRLIQEEAVYADDRFFFICGFFYFAPPVLCIVGLYSKYSRALT